MLGWHKADPDLAETMAELSKRTELITDTCINVCIMHVVFKTQIHECLMGICKTVTITSNLDNL